MKLAFLGNSHVACMLMAYRENAAVLGAEFKPTFFASSRRSMGDFRLDGQDLVPGSNNLEKQIARSSGGQARLEAKAFDAFYLVGMRFVFPVLERSYSRAVLRSLLQTMLAQAESWHLVRLLRKVTDRPIFCAHQPLVALEPAQVQFHTYEDVQKMLAELVSGLDVRLLSQPVETRTHDLFTKAEFTTGSRRLNTGALHPGDDLEHMNSSYGAICLRHFRDELESL